MDVEEYYCRLRKTFADVPEKESLFLSMDRICDILSCTRRNVQILLTKMIEKDYVEWKPGRGRGNLSQIIFLISYRDVVLGKVKGLVEKGRITEVWSMLETLQDSSVKSDIMAWLTELFGLKRDEGEKDILRFPFYRPVLRLDPAYVCRRTETHWIEQIFNTLVKYSQQDYKFHPQLAHYWETNDAKTSWTFFLRKGVRFHHGKLLTSRDVAYTFKRLLTNSPSEWITSMIKEIRETGKYSITFELKEPNVLFLHFLCTERSMIVPEMLDGTESEDIFERMPIGTGPFKMIQNNESMLVVEANEYYFEGCPHLDRIEMWVFPNYEDDHGMQFSQADEQLVYFEAQVMKTLSPSLRQVEQGSTILTLNVAKNNVLKDLKLRKAIHHGINRQQMINDLGGIRHEPSAGFTLADSAHLYVQAFDKEYAEELVKESLYNGETLTLYTYQMPANEQSAKWIKEACGSIGIAVEIVVLPIDELAVPAVVAQADMILTGEVLSIQPDISLIEMYMSKVSFVTNLQSLANQAYIREQIMLCLRNDNLDVRMQHLLSIQEELKRSYSMLFLYHSMQQVGHNQALQGISLNAWGKIDYKDVWLRK
ncbi:SgrR family transcriptional regulator [Bacillus sp. FJAT-26390]|uniref:SgrR family transcriptional regulator n=1 Tax=Bacillus sp. FJAT-26390 TaxID=1743142 RepID=UPI000807E87F|nr:SgrR family transcriptional regulator [Bacillus sp. FJAT-26390]OBZ17055.1 hypothetical protein A7975_03960 [Bacillus sp. FJAT-26390]